MRRSVLSLSTALLFAAALAACGPGARPPQDVVPETTARSTALARVPGARVRSHELEYEDGRWIYSYDLEVPGQDGIQEVQVDAVTGEVVSQEHEDAAAEQEEAGSEADHDTT